MSSRERLRRGATLLEVVIAVGLLAAAMSLSLQVLTLVAAARRSYQRRLVATEEAANCLERLRLLPSSELNNELAGQMQLPAEALNQLPGGELQVRISDHARPVSGKRIAVQVRWRHRSGEYEAPVRLTAWRWEAP
jgi:type II secretory pathway pseudopilin PulG